MAGICAITYSEWVQVQTDKSRSLSLDLNVHFQVGILNPMKLQKKSQIYMLIVDLKVHKENPLQLCFFLYVSHVPVGNLFQ